MKINNKTPTERRLAGEPSDFELFCAKNPMDKQMTNQKCACACHENKLNQPYEHDNQCCEYMNGHVVDKREEWEMNYKEVVGKSQVHRWMDVHYGQPRICESETCDGKTEKRWFDWALKTGHEYERKRENFLRLCRSCHRRYDMTEKLKTKAMKNLHWNGKKNIHRLTEEEVLKIRADYANGMRQYEIAKKYSIENSRIYQVVNRKSWKHI